MLTARILLVLLLAISISGCEQEVAQPIQWQLPLTPDYDPHQANHQATMPDWAANNKGSIQLRLLSTTSGKQFPLLIPVGGEASVQDISIHLMGLAKGLRVRSGGLAFDDPKVDNPAAFLVIRYKQRPRFAGWIYRDFPEMFTPDITGWKFFLDTVTIRPASQPSSDLVDSSLNHKLP